MRSRLEKQQIALKKLEHTIARFEKDSADAHKVFIRLLLYHPVSLLKRGQLLASSACLRFALLCMGALAPLEQSPSKWGFSSTPGPD